MRITGIEHQKKNPKRVSICVDGEPALDIDAETLLRAGLRTGDEISQERIASLAREEEATNARRTALRFLAPRPRTVREIRDKLRETEFADEDIEQTIESLKQAGLLNDFEFARMYIRDARSAKSTGKALLKRKLLLLGVDKAEVDGALREAFAGVDEHAEALEAARKFLKRSTAIRKPSDKGRLQDRLAGFLSRRGFNWETIEPVIRELIRKQDE